MDAIKIVEQAFAQNKAAQYPEFKAGDTITVVYKVKEGDKVIYSQYSGTDVKLEDEEYIVVGQDDIIAIVE